MELPLKSGIILKASGETIDKIVESRVAARLNKGAGPSDLLVSLYPQQVNLPYPGGGLRKSFPLGVSFRILRDFSNYYPIARSCIEYRKSQIMQLDWKIVPIDLSSETLNDKTNVTNCKKITDFLKRPQGDKNRTFHTWLKTLLEDLFVIDAVALYRKRNRKGDVIGYLPVDAATIDLVLENDGTTPADDKAAYVQRVRGQEIARLTTDELLYTMMNPRTYTPFGFAPLESLIITVTTALKVQAYNLASLVEGNVPEGFVEVPRDIASSRDQLKAWQDAWDAMLSGDPRFQRKLKFLPEGMKYEPTVKMSDMTFERFEKWLLLNTCSVFGVAPSSIGFTFDTNRATSTTSVNQDRERSLYPTSIFINELIDKIIQEDLGHPELEFSWTNISLATKPEEVKAVRDMIQGGMLAVDEWRLRQGLPPTGAKDPLFMTPIGPIFVKDLARQSDAGQMPILPYKPAGQTAPTDEKKPPSGEAMVTPNVPSVAYQKRDKMEELRKWRKAAINDWKNGKSPRLFKTDILDDHTQVIIKSGLSNAKTREEIDMVFAPLINSEYRDDVHLMNLYDEIDNILDGQKNSVESASRCFATG
ncbi:MAG: phage portal protein [Actinomycetota bacterium]